MMADDLLTAFVVYGLRALFCLRRVDDGGVEAQLGLRWYLFANRFPIIFQIIQSANTDHSWNG
jgi:hypothetical protein